jgi:ABC-2 type transport system permease protein
MSALHVERRRMMPPPASAVTRLITKRNRAVLRELVITDFKLRYQGSLLGYAWSLLRPLLIFLILYVVFARFLRLGRGVPHYPVYLLLGLVMWTLFSDVTGQGLTSIVYRGDILRKVNIPRWIIVVGSSISVLINFLLNLVVVVVFMAATSVTPSVRLLWLPLIFLEVYALALGLAFFLGAAYVRFRDMSYIWEVIVQMFFYLTPIIYPLSLIHNRLYQQLMFVNPMAQAIQDARYSAITTTTTMISTAYHSTAIRLMPIAITLAVLVIGRWFFRREARYFAENL